MTRGAIFWAIILAVAMIALSYVFGKELNTFFNSCNPVVFGQTRMDNIEWECRAQPPEGTKFRDVMEATAIHKDRQEAEKSAVWLCNKIFKTDKCKVDRCRQVRRRK